MGSLIEYIFPVNNTMTKAFSYDHIYLITMILIYYASKELSAEFYLMKTYIAMDKKGVKSYK